MQSGILQHTWCSDVMFGLLKRLATRWLQPIRVHDYAVHTMRAAMQHSVTYISPESIAHVCMLPLHNVSQLCGCSECREFHMSAPHTAAAR
jgi:hypothetical protein